MPTIKVQKIPEKEVKIEDILMQFCYYFPRYSYAEAKAMQYKRVILMLQTAQKENAKKMLELVHIVTAPHTKNGTAVKNLISHYQNILEK